MWGVPFTHDGGFPRFSLVTVQWDQTGLAIHHTRGGWMMLNICDVENGNWKQCRCQNALGLTRSLCIVFATGDCDGEALPIFGVWVARLRCSWYISVISRGGAVCSALISVTFQYLCAAVVQNAWTVLSRLQAVAVEVPQQTNNFDCGIYVGTSVIWSLWSVHWWMCLSDRCWSLCNSAWFWGCWRFLHVFFFGLCYVTWCPFTLLRWSLQTLRIP